MTVEHPASLSALRQVFANNTYVAIDFTAAWCGPCKVIGPVFEKLSAQHAIPGTFAFAKVDVDEAQDIAREYGISAMPTFMFFKEGKQVAVNGQSLIRGADAKSLSAAVAKIGGLAKKRAEEKK